MLKRDGLFSPQRERQWTCSSAFLSIPWNPTKCHINICKPSRKFIQLFFVKNPQNNFCAFWRTKVAFFRDLVCHMTLNLDLQPDLLVNTFDVLATSITKWYCSHTYFRPDPSAAAIHQCSTGLAVFLKRNDTPLYICLHLGNEGASVFLFVHQAKGISRPPPDSHCCNWVVAMSTTVPSEAPGNSHTTKALFYSTFHMSGAQM